MTQEEKAKAYDEALERARNLHKDATDMEEGILAKQCEIIFPELRESEDEKRRKIITLCLEECVHSDIIRDYEKDDAIAWLEKQDGHKPVIEMKSPEESLGISSKEYNDIINDCLYGESKSANKVESKFKVGDWVVDSCGYVWKIEGILNQFYILEGVEGGESRPTIEWVNKTFHLWTIQDAKDGDALALSYASKNYIIIYRGLYEKSFNTIMSVFCSYSVEEDTYYDETDSFHAMNTGESIKPATKEQRDLLFQKMKEAGYMWDSKNKQILSLKAEPSGKQKPAAWSEEDDMMLECVLDKIGDLGTGVMCKGWLKSLKQRHTWKPTDEQMKALDSVIDEYDGYPEFDSLVSLKNDLKKL